ncbi:hypothetical protein QWZ06_15675 [Chryseobacterium tructae]|uniref:DUF3471 domain-containing protein n=1 Tax=Chryseobacterium tructae TaxID=1037380 RepID=A0ABV7XY05_9FLAO|nr:hypothetical protein [Chryseobacterium tructae]MDN3693625.1 hypothetical protein [Chryseobacterium tructae]
MMWYRNLLTVIGLLLINLFSAQSCNFDDFVNDLSQGNAVFKSIVNEEDGFKAWQILAEEAPALRKNADELNLVSKNLSAIEKAGGYKKWKGIKESIQGARGLNFTQLIKNNLNKIGVSDDVTKYVLASNSKGGAYILQGVNIEAKEIALADEIFVLTDQKSIFPKDNLQAIEGFFENGTAFTMKELDKNFNFFATRINEMSSKIKADPNFQWIGAEGYLKIPFESFTKNDGSIQVVTRQYVEQQFNASIGRNAFTIKNDGTLKNIRVFLKDGSTFNFDLTKLKP